MHDYTMMFGPQHPSMKEPINIRLMLDGNYIKKVDMRFGYIHRGIEKILEGKNINKAIYLAEHICGICSFAHSGCSTMSFERMIGIDPPKKVKFLRTIVAELERIHSHVLWAGFACHEIGYETLFHYFWREREHILDMFERLTGNRVHHNFNKIGSVRFDLEGDDIDFFLEKIAEMEKGFKVDAKEFSANSVLRARFRDVGVISKEMAKEYCLVGPMARASGVKCDIRKLDPYEAYPDVKFKEIIMKRGDSFERGMVRMKEVEESISIVRQLLKKMPSEPLPKPQLQSLKQGEGYGRVEAPRGEDFHFYKVKDSIIERAKIRTPTLAVIMSLEKMLVGAEIGDTPVIIASIDPCIGCMERMMVVKDGRQETLTEREFRGKYCD